MSGGRLQRLRIADTHETERPIRLFPSAPVWHRQFRCRRRPIRLIGGIPGSQGITFFDKLAAAKGGSSKNGGGGKDKDGGGKDGLLGNGTSNIAGGGNNVEIVLKGRWTAEPRQAFMDAADLIGSMILGDVMDVRFRGQTIDDIRIEAALTDIDGEGGVMGQAGPTVHRTATFQPATGKRELDIADAVAFDAKGPSNGIVFDAILHALGFGTPRVLTGFFDNNTDGAITFNGTNANLAFDSEFDILVAVAPETGGGGGAVGGHWNEGDLGRVADTDEFDFVYEIMIGCISHLRK